MDLGLNYSIIIYNSVFILFKSLTIGLDGWVHKNVPRKLEDLENMQSYWIVFVVL